MADFQGQIESERGKLKELLLKVPGFKGYIELEDRRTADKLLREIVADRYQEQLTKLTDVQTQFVDRGDLSYVDDLETIAVRFRTFIDKISHAAYGYSSFFSVIKIDAEKLDKIYAYDHALLDGIDQITASLVSLETEKDPELLESLISELKKVAADMVTKADQRMEEINKEDDIPSE
jgi:hypothetical protein